MLTSEIQSWINKSRNEGKTDKEIRKEMQKSGWGKDQIDGFLLEKQHQKKAEVSKKIPANLGLPAAKKQPFNFNIGLAVLVLLVVAAGTLFIGASFDWLGDDDANINLPGYNSNTNSGWDSSGVVTKTFQQQLAAQSAMGQFEDYDQLRSFLDDHASSDSSAYYGFGGSAVPRSGMMLEDLGSTLSLDEAGLGDSVSEIKSDDYSTTNIQVEGVDEADIIKTDGKYIYAVSKKNVFIIDAYPAGESKILSTIVLKSTPKDIYINGDSLVIYGRDDNVSTQPFISSIRPYSSYTYLKVFDTKDKKNPKQVRNLDFEGSYNNSRMIGDYVYFITTHPTTYIDDDFPFPIIIEDEEVLPIEVGAPRCNCPDIYYIDAPYQNYTYTTVSAINVADNDQAISSDMYLLGSGENMYVSQKNIYLVYTKYISEYQLTLESTKDLLYDLLSAKDIQRINDIESAPMHILSEFEKTQKVLMILSKYINSFTTEEAEEYEENLEKKIKQKYDDIAKELEKTVIHKIAIDEDSLSYQGSGEVTGHVLNQFSMDEHDGYFRIATTKGRTWTSFGLDGENESYSNVYVLDEDLKVVGAVEELAKTEQIYSARFMQGRVYLVTFRQTDPLFAIDLTEPTNPKVLGELKVPGFSSYLHPYDENKLIGFGKQADDSGRVQGLKLSLFDVSDVSNMKELDTYEMGDSRSSSIALDDHKAFLFSKDKNLLAIPVTMSEEITEGSYRYKYTHGLMVLAIDGDGFTFRERLDHSDGTAADSNSNYYYGYNHYDTTVLRSLYIDDVLYSMSNKYLKMNSLDDLTAINSVTLEPSDSDDDFTVIR